MITALRLVLIPVILTFFIDACQNDNPVSISPNPSPLSSTHDAAFAGQWMDLLYNVVADQAPSPCVASRIYSYSAITLYESVRNGIPFGLSLSGQLNLMPAMPQINHDEIYDWPSVITGSMSVAAASLFDTLYNYAHYKINTLKANQIESRRAVIPADVVDRSVAYGESIAQKILAWASTDGFIERRSMHYTVPSRNGHPEFWEPTDPVHLNPSEPFWSTLRPFVMANSHACYVPLNVPFDTTQGSAFYNIALEVKNTVENLTAEQQEIALYWQDKLRTGTPPGHWVSIMNQVTGIMNLKLDKACEMYAAACIAMADAFISCWETKFRINYLRPKTYIKYWIGPADWDSFITTPPFPGYTSGHSCQSAACAEVLTSMFGDVAFTDTALVSLGFQPRSFSSFYAARDEAVMSRLYGGIHFRTDNELGVQQGRLVGRTVLDRIRFSAISP
jgi:PAP2 superfamily protein